MIKTTCIISKGVNIITCIMIDTVSEGIITCIINIRSFDLLYL